MQVGLTLLTSQRLVAEQHVGAVSGVFLLSLESSRRRSTLPLIEEKSA